MKNKKFVLTRRNQKGQVAIFVALIFQVVFVFFAVLINVGLLVHHKINLQQSTDLAAYYGAMKQAEIMNAISHVNFQMRQAWKLLTWRYRVLGTFGFQNNGAVPPTKLNFPLDISFTAGDPTKYVGLADAQATCPNGVNILDVPFFCVAHAGMKGWKSGAENNCRVSCDQINNIPNQIPAVKSTSGYDNNWTGGVAASVNASLDKANQNISDLCDAIGPQNFNLLAKHIVAYAAEVQQKKKLIQMLGADLSKNETSVDLDGGLIKEGSRKTFEHNLTEANLTGKLSFQTINGLAGSDCAFDGTSSDGNGSRAQFLSQIKFEAIQFFIHQCSGLVAGTKNFVPISIYADASFQTLANEFISKLPAADQGKITSAIVNAEYIIGYEKNPWCQVYYGAKAQTEPKIPFLPMAKIKLSAISIAKPFGGTIGPRYFSGWSSGSSARTSDSGAKVDSTLPVKAVTSIPPGPPLLKYQSILMNYSHFLGDNKGLKDPEVVATYQDLLLHRQITGSLTGTENISTGKDVSGARGPSDNANLGVATVWPSFTNWSNLGEPEAANYDYLANEPIDLNSFMRDLEISVIAPNQFDLNYYSIDPDYFNNYYRKIVGGTVGSKTYTASFSKLLSAAGYGPNSVNDVKPDYGNNVSLQGKNAIANSYSVRHQLAVSAEIVKKTPHRAVGPWNSTDVAGALKFIPNKTSSLLTGWTFSTFSDYTKFPNDGPNPEYSMTFGKCADSWNSTNDTDVEKSYGSPVSKNLPPTPGNCVTGGRTGYSVKLISPSLVRVGAQPEPYGGAGTSGVINNPADESFFTF